MSDYLKQKWQRSKVFRTVVIVLAVYALLRLAVHGVFLAEVLRSGDLEGHDLQVYLDAAARMTLRQDLYPSGEMEDWIEFYQYSPAYALAFTVFLHLPIAVTMAVLSLLHVAAYVLLYWRWDCLFDQLGLAHARDVLAGVLPIWILFSQFWADLGYLNVYIFLALAATLLIEAVLKRQLGWSLLWLAFILQLKPQWAFALALPLLLGHTRFFFKLLAGTAVIYIGILGLTLLIVGPAYGWEQQIEYMRLLSSISSGNYPWRGPDAPFLGYNHSIAQIVVYLFGISAINLQLATGIQLLLLLPLGVIGLRYLWRPPSQIGSEAAEIKLDLACALYLGAFIWLDVVWEVTLGIAVFTYLVATLRPKWARMLVWGVFLAYALLDFWQLVSFLVFGMDIILPGLYVATDPSIYLPLTMIVILTFYGLLIGRLWKRSHYRGEAAA